MLRALAPASLCLASALAQTNFPPPPHPTNNPPDAQKALLGMALFFEEQLSATGTVACATCHDLGRGGVDGRAGRAINPGPDGLLGTADDQFGSPGVTGSLADGTLVPHSVHGFGANVTTRRSPSVVNSGYHSVLTYDGGKTTLEQVIAVPPVHSVEMGFVGRTWVDVSAKIAASTPLFFASYLPPRLEAFVAGRTYPQLFAAVFGSPAVTEDRIVKAIATYVRTLNSDQSKWDLVRMGLATLTPQEQHGKTLFDTPANGATSCRTCHGDFEVSVGTTGPRVGQMTMTSFGPYGSHIPSLLLFHNIGIRPPVEDPGRQLVSNSIADSGKFRVASLRNVELAAPYFHNGGARTLRDVLDFYDRGGDFHVNQAAMLTPRGYTAAEKDALVALLRTLTDPRLAAGVEPFDRPVLGSESLRFATAFGRGSPMPGGALLAHAPFAPRLGEQKFRLALSGASPGAWAFLMFDVALGSGGAAPFEIELGLTPAFSIFGIGPTATGSQAGNGTLQVPLPLPGNPLLSGQVLFAQWLVLEPSLTGPFATSNALHLPLQ